MYSIDRKMNVLIGCNQCFLSLQAKFSDKSNILLLKKYFENIFYVNSSYESKFLTQNSIDGAHARYTNLTFFSFHIYM